LLRSQRRHATELRGQALQDVLTGVDNRRGFFHRVDELLAARRDPASPLHALLLFDFDHFKRINDRCGHPFGDIVLSISLQRLGEVVGARGHLGRLGGEEFAALCPNLGGQRALQLAEAMRRAVAGIVFPQAPENLEVTISIGVALFDGVHSRDPASWLRNADKALYAAKTQGRDQVVAAQAVTALLSRAGSDSAWCMD
jgi:diguanylate cyclase (GGDEF)-like protein